MQYITIEKREHLFLIGFNRTEKMNAFNRQMLEELAQAYTQYEDDKNLWCALIFAHGDHFTSGLDLGDVGPAVMKGEALLIQEMTEGNPFDRALAIAETIAKQAPLAVQATITAVQEAMNEGEEKAIENLLPVARKLMQTKDAAEGLASFLERRDAQFRGE